jgi:hypothetical protein
MSLPGNSSATDESIAQNATVNKSYNNEVDAEDTEIPDFIEDSPMVKYATCFRHLLKVVNINSNYTLDC